MRVGDDVVLRYITRDGRPGMSWAARLVDDRVDMVALFLPKGTPHKRWEQTDEGRVLTDSAWSTDTLRLMYVQQPYSIWLSWDNAGTFRGYYVNLEEPFRRTPIGFDTNDHQLDIVVTPELRWSMKDEDVVAERERDGSFSTEFVAELRRAAGRIVESIERRAAPFDGSWVAWRPERSWPTPTLHPRWNVEPAAQWERRLWAYPRAAERVASESG
jgi:predicted RNA-binding protein associated with RNAse of E/G family